MTIGAVRHGPRVRVWKIVRCPATDSSRYIMVWSARRKRQIPTVPGARHRPRTVPIDQLARPMRQEQFSK